MENFQKFIGVGPSTSDPRETKFFNSIFVCSRMHSKSICKYFVMNYTFQRSDIVIV